MNDAQKHDSKVEALRRAMDLKTSNQEVKTAEDVAAAARVFYAFLVEGPKV